MISNELNQNILMLSVIAKPGMRFESYDLLQAISATGLKFGEKNIFHYYQLHGCEKKTLFCLASATTSGEFDLNNIGDLSCAGLVLFMNLSADLDLPYAFNLMLETAEQLADDLEGELFADPQTKWTDEICRQYREKLIRAKNLPHYEF